MTHGRPHLPLPPGILRRPVPSQNRDLAPCSGQSPGTSRSLQLYNEYQKVYKVAEVRDSGWLFCIPTLRVMRYHLGTDVRTQKSEAGMLFKDQVALITGASSGIGRATAEAMGRQGARVGVNYCKNQVGAEQAAETIRKAGSEALVLRADVTRDADVLAMVEAVRKEWGRIDILVNNAGDLLARRTLANMTEEYWDLIMALNLKSAFLCVKAVWEEMVARKSGCIVNVSSIAGRNGGGPGAAAYSAAKGDS